MKTTSMVMATLKRWKRCDEKQAEKEKPVMSETLPHLQISIPQQEPPMIPPMMEEEEDPLQMSDQFNEGQQFGAMTGMPDMGNLSLGAATGTMPARAVCSLQVNLWRMLGLV